MVTPFQLLRPHELTVDGLRVHLWSGGTGPAVLLLHAAWGDAELSWCKVGDQLARSFTVIAPDLPGFGGSASLPRPSLAAMAKVLKHVLDSLQLDRVMVFGNSFGAAVALQFAGDVPNTASRLVLVNGGHLPPLPHGARTFISLPLVEQGFPWLMRQFSFSSFAQNGSIADRSKLPAGFIEQMKRNARAYSDITFDCFMGLTGYLPVPAVPTFLVWGAQDRLTPLKQAGALQKRIPGARLIVIEDAGHMPQPERPRESLSAIMGVEATNE